MTFKNLKEIGQALKDLEARGRKGGMNDEIVLIWLVVIVADIVDYLKQKENER